MSTKNVCLLFIALISLCSAFQYYKNENESSLRLAIHKSEFPNIMNYLSPMVLKEFGNIPISDKTFSFKGVEITLSDINVGVTAFAPDSVKIDFQEPDIILKKVSNIEAAGKMKFNLKWKSLSITELVDLTLKFKEVDAKAHFITREKDQKLFPTFLAEELKTDIDISLKFDGSALSYFLNKLSDQVLPIIVDILNPFIEVHGPKLITQALEKLPTYLPIIKPYVLDYSFVSAPAVENGYLLLNIYAGLANSIVPSTFERRIPLSTVVPKYNPEGKPIQLSISEYPINTALSTLYLSDFLQIYITNDKSPEYLNTKYLSALFWGIDTVYGYNTPWDVEVLAFDAPSFKILDKSFNVTLPLEISVNAIQGQNKTLAITMRTDMKISSKLNVLENGNITAEVLDIKAGNIKLVNNTLPLVTPELLQEQIDVFTEVAIEPINSSIIKELKKFVLPVIKGIKLTDLTGVFFPEYLAINYHFLYENVTLA